VNRLRVRGNVTAVLDNGDRELQHIVSAHRYYGSETKRQDNVMIEESNDAPLGSTSSHVPRNVLIAKVQVFLAIKKHRRVRIMSELRGQGDQSAEDESCLLRYYCRVSAASINAVDRALNCVKIRWSVREEEKGADGRPMAVDDELPSVADVAHIDAQSVSTIRGLLHIVRGTMSFEARNLSLTSTGAARRTGFIRTGSSNLLATRSIQYWTSTRRRIYPLHFSKEKTKSTSRSHSHSSLALSSNIAAKVGELRPLIPTKPSDTNPIQLQTCSLKAMGAKSR
jgi:hypothetical protein